MLLHCTAMSCELISSLHQSRLPKSQPSLLAPVIHRHRQVLTSLTRVCSRRWRRFISHNTSSKNSSMDALWRCSCASSRQRLHSLCWLWWLITQPWYHAIGTISMLVWSLELPEIICSYPLTLAHSDQLLTSSRSCSCCLCPSCHILITSDTIDWHVAGLFCMPS